MTLHVYINKGRNHVAMIAKPSRDADAYVPEEPWCLLHNSGRVDRFVSQRDAKAEATKTYAPCVIKRT